MVSYLKDRELKKIMKRVTNPDKYSVKLSNADKIEIWQKFENFVATKQQRPARQVKLHLGPQDDTKSFVSNDLETLYLTTSALNYPFYIAMYEVLHQGYRYMTYEENLNKYRNNFTPEEFALLEINSKKSMFNKDDKIGLHKTNNKDEYENQPIFYTPKKHAYMDVCEILEEYKFKNAIPGFEKQINKPGSKNIYDEVVYQSEILPMQKRNMQFSRNKILEEENIANELEQEFNKNTSDYVGKSYDKWPNDKLVALFFNTGWDKLDVDKKTNLVTTYFKKEGIHLGGSDQLRAVLESVDGIQLIDIVYANVINKSMAKKLKVKKVNILDSIHACKDEKYVRFIKNNPDVIGNKIKDFQKGKYDFDSMYTFDKINYLMFLMPNFEMVLNQYVKPLNARIEELEEIYGKNIYINKNVLETKKFTDFILNEDYKKVIGEDLINEFNKSQEKQVEFKKSIGTTRIKL